MMFYIEQLIIVLACFDIVNSQYLFQKEVDED